MAYREGRLQRLGFGGERVEEPVPIDAIELAAPRLKPPASLDGILSADPPDRIRHAMGRAYRDVVRGFRGRFDRTPDLVVEYCKAAQMRGLRVIIAGAGMSAALPGVAAAHTSLPVVGVPIAGKNLGGMDALLAIAQMPPGVPVGCMAVDGAKNAGLYAARIIGP